MCHAPVSIASRLRTQALHASCGIGGILRAPVILRSVKRVVGPTNAPLEGWRSRVATLFRIGFDPGEISKQTRLNLRPKYLPVEGLLGEKYSVDVNDHIGWNMFVKGYFDCAPIAVAVLLNQHDPGGTFLDVGANIGGTSIPLAKLGIPTVGVEASASIIRDLVTNVSLNSPIPYTVVHAAVTSPGQSETEAFAEMYFSKGNVGGSSLFKSWISFPDDSKTEMSRTTTLDEIIRWLGLTKLTAVKLDIEGAEFVALEGFQQTLSEQRPAVTFEWRPDGYQKSGVASGDIRKLFPADYVFHAIGVTVDNEQAHIALNSFSLDTISPNVLAIPSEHPAVAEFKTDSAMVRLVPPR
jgi:FkbM family methyltransferase